MTCVPSWGVVIVTIFEIGPLNPLLAAMTWNVYCVFGFKPAMLARVSRVESVVSIVDPDARYTTK